MYCYLICRVPEANKIIIIVQHFVFLNPNVRKYGQEIKIYF